MVGGVAVLVRRDVPGRGRQRGRRGIGPGEVEGRGQVAADGTAPRGDVGLLDPEALLHEADHRGVVEGLGADVAALAPGGDHDHRDARAEPVRSGRVAAATGVEVLRHVGRGQAPGGGGRRVRRDHVVEEAVVLVVGDEQGGLGPDRRVRGQRVQDLRDVPGAEVRRPVRVLAERLGGGDPGDLGQRAAHHVRAQPVEVAVARLDVRARAGLLVQGAAGLGAPVGVEVQQRVVAVVAAEGVVDPAPGTGRVQAVADVLVDLPRDPGGLQPLGVGLPAVAGLLVAEDRAAAGPVVARVTRPQVVAVRVRGADERAVVGVAHREGVGEGVVERDVVPGHVRHGRGRLGRDPLVVLAVVVRLVAAGPVVVEPLQELHAEVLDLRVEGQDVLRSVRLVEDRLAVVLEDRPRVAEAPYPLHRAEVVVEGPVLLHQDDDVLDVLDRSGGALRRDGGGPRDAVVQHREGGGATGYLQEPATVELCHGVTTSGGEGGVEGRPKDSGPGVPAGDHFVTLRRTPGERKELPNDLHIC